MAVATKCAKSHLKLHKHSADYSKQKNERLRHRKFKRRSLTQKYKGNCEKVKQGHVCKLALLKIIHSWKFQSCTLIRCA